MHNVAPSRALARRSRQLLTIAFVVGAVGVFISVAALALFVVPLVAPRSPSYSLFVFGRIALLLLGLAVFLVAVGVAVRAVTWKTDNELAKVVGGVLERYLDTRYHFIRNVSQRDLGYIDAVLIGPPGVLVFRIMSMTGNLANEGANWLRRDKQGRWEVAGINPTREVVDDVKRLREFLQRQRLGNVPVFAVVVFTKEPPALQLMAREPVVPVTTLNSLVNNLSSNYLAKDRIEPDTVTAVVRTLYNA